MTEIAIHPVSTSPAALHGPTGVTTTHDVDTACRADRTIAAGAGRIVGDTGRTPPHAGPR